MWFYDSPIGRLYIVELPGGRYGFKYHGQIWESCDTPQQEADNVYCHVTNCPDWDCLEGVVEPPRDLSEWVFVRTSSDRSDR